MRLVILGPTHPYRGGIAHYTTLLAHALAARHDVVFLTFVHQYPRRLFPGRSDRDPSAHPIKTPAERVLAPLRPWTWWRTARRAAAADPDLVLIQWWVPFWAPSLAAVAWLARRWTRARIVFVCHNVLPHDGGGRWVRALVRLALGRGDAFILHSDADARALAELLPGVPSSAIHRALLPAHTIAPEAASATEPAGSLATEPDPAAAGGHGAAGNPAPRFDRAAFLARFGIPPDAAVALFFGFVRPYKGLRHLVDALPAAVATAPHLHLLVAGEFWLPAQAFADQARALGVADRWHADDRYIANEEVGPYFQAADVLVMPYVEATQSGVVTLAVEFGVPIVATRVGGLPEAVADGETGLIVPPADPAALAAAVARVVTDGVLRARLAAGVVRARERFGWAPLVALIEGLVPAGDAAAAPRQ